jgi:hypothetical protein
MELSTIKINQLFFDFFDERAENRPHWSENYRFLLKVASILRHSVSKSKIYDCDF